MRVAQKRDRSNDICVNSIKRLSIDVESSLAFVDDDDDDTVYPADVEDNVGQRRLSKKPPSATFLPEVPCLLKHRRRVDKAIDNLMQKTYRKSLEQSSVKGSSFSNKSEISIPASIGPHPGTDLKFLTYKHHCSDDDDEGNNSALGLISSFTGGNQIKNSAIKFQKDVSENAPNKCNLSVFCESPSKTKISSISGLQHQIYITDDFSSPVTHAISSATELHLENPHLHGDDFFCHNSSYVKMAVNKNDREYNSLFGVNASQHDGEHNSFMSR